MNWEELHEDLYKYESIQRGDPKYYSDPIYKEHIDLKINAILFEIGIYDHEDQLMRKQTKINRYNIHIKTLLSYVWNRWIRRK
tara:strand:+ start:1084 stop:1332 length:249 start_codon:yes stop_codon:yes gene_type:complete